MARKFLPVRRKRTDYEKQWNEKKPPISTGGFLLRFLSGKPGGPCSTHGYDWMRVLRAFFRGMREKERKT